MSNHDWDKIKLLFENALNLPESERMDHLRLACGSDSRLSDFVSRLLENHREDPTSSAGIVRQRVFEDGALISGRLRVTRFIAGGGMGEVYEVYDERLRKRFALKTLRLHMAATQDACDRFKREVLIARGVSHTNLCNVFDFIEHRFTRSDTGESTIIPCLTMELVEGENLAAFLARERPLTAIIALPLIRQVAAGLNALHERGIVHRDLKPSNVMLANEAGGVRVVLMDFGLAKSAIETDEFFETRTDLHAGAPYFMAPELLRECRPSVASDIYSLGLLIDEMVTRERAFPAESLQSLYFAKLWEKPIEPSRRVDGLPASWEKAILRCLSRDPGDRFKRTSDVLAVLEQASDRAVDARRAFFTRAWSPLRALGGKNSFIPRRLRRPVATGALATLSLLGAAVTFASFSAASFPVAIKVYDVRNTTGDLSYDYLCRGTSLELTRRLSGLRGVRTIPMHSIRSGLPDQNEGRFGIAGDLEINGGQLRLGLTVTDDRDHKVIYSQVFDRSKIDAPLELQAEAATGTAQAFEKQLALGNLGQKIEQSSLSPLLSRLRFGFFRPLSEQLQSSPTSNSEAFDLYLRGHQLLEEFSASSNQAAISYLKRAVAADPSFALGYATLADAYLNMMNFYQIPQPDLLLAARRNAEMAVSLDPSLAEARGSLAVVHQTDWQWHDAERSFLEALRLKHGYAIGRRRYAGLLVQLGRFDEALPLAREAYSQDPYDRSAAPGVGLYFFLAHRYDEAMQLLESAIGDRDMPFARHNLGDVYAELALQSTGRAREEYFAKAFAQAAKVAAIEAAEDSQKGAFTPVSNEMYAHYYSLESNYSAAQPYFDRLLADTEAHRFSPAIAAWIYAVQGQNERALDMLDRALAARDRKLFYVKQYPALATLRNEPRFKELIANMGL